MVDVRARHTLWYDPCHLAWQVRKILTGEFNNNATSRECVQNLIHLPDELAGVLHSIAIDSSQGIFFTCHARWQGSSRTMSCPYYTIDCVNPHLTE